MNSKGRIVIKLGGGLITNKNLSKTINKEARALAEVSEKQGIEDKTGSNK